MPDYWITTHWPVPADMPDLSRHVYVKDKNVSLPQIGDVVFIRESKSRPMWEGNTVRRVTRIHRGERTEHDLPEGYGGLIGMATIDGKVRLINDEDVVFEYGNLREWRAIPTKDFRAGRLPYETLKELLGAENSRHLSLWKIPDDGRAERILQAMQWL